MEKNVDANTFIIKRKTVRKKSSIFVTKKYFFNYINQMYIVCIKSQEL